MTQNAKKVLIKDQVLKIRTLLEAVLFTSHHNISYMRNSIKFKSPPHPIPPSWTQGLWNVYPWAGEVFPAELAVTGSWQFEDKPYKDILKTFGPFHFKCTVFTNA